MSVNVETLTEERPAHTAEDQACCGKDRVIVRRRVLPYKASPFEPCPLAAEFAATTVCNRCGESDTALVCQRHLERLSNMIPGTIRHAGHLSSFTFTAIPLRTT